MLAYLLRDIPPSLWPRVKARAEREGFSIRDVMLTLLRFYADGKLTTQTVIMGKGEDQP